MAEYRFFSHKGLDNKYVSDRADAAHVGAWRRSTRLTLLLAAAILTRSVLPLSSGSSPLDIGATYSIAVGRSLPLGFRSLRMVLLLHPGISDEK